MTRSIRCIIAAVALATGAAAVTARQQTRDATPASAGTGSISGVVLIDGPSKQPARRARVTVANLARTSPGQTATTDDNGAFTFTGLPAGRFEIQATKPGYLRGSYGAQRPERSGTPVVLKDAEAIPTIAITIARGGVISGLVRDQRGKPSPGQNVRVLKIGYNALSGERTLGAPSSGATTMTDDRGIYRAYGLPPGEYMVLVQPGQSGRSGGLGSEDIRVLTSAELQRVLQAAKAATAPAATPVASPTPTPRVSYAPVFHPGVTDLGAARTVPLGLSEEKSGVDIAFQLAPAAAIRGTVSDPSGQLPATLQVRISPLGPSPEMLAGAGLMAGSSAIRPDGTFLVSSVTPGTYKVRVETGFGRGRSAGPTGPMKWASAEATVNGRDVDVALSLRDGIVINGRVVVEGAQPTPADLQALSFRLLPSGSGGQLLSGGGGVVDANGRFTFPGLAPNDYQFATSWTPAATDRWTLKSSVANGRDAFESPLRIDGNEPTIDWVVTFTDKPTTLVGTFQDRGGRAATDYYLLVFSTDRSRWTPGSRRVRTVRPATDGAFSIKGLPAGEYFLAALIDLAPGEWNDATLLEQLVPTAAKVQLRDGQVTTQDFRIGG